MAELKDPSQGVRTVDVSAVEAELSQLWQQMAEVSSEQEQAIIRACVLNLMIYVPGEKCMGEVSQLTAEVTTEHPSRVIVVCANPGASEPALGAVVSAQCHASAAGRKQICCEQIGIQADGEGTHQLPSLVRALVVPDLPVFLWWRDVLDFENPLLNELVETSDRVIIDSAALPDTEGGLGRLTSFISEKAQWNAFSDLNWSRLTPWRGLIAGFFDLPECRPYLARLDRVEIEGVGGGSDGYSIPTQAVLLAAWFASRLEWKPVSRPQRISEHAYQFQLNAENRNLVIQIGTSPSAKPVCAGLHSVELVVREAPSARFAVFPGLDDQHLESHVMLGRRELVTRFMRLDDLGEAQLVGKELEITGHDNVYEQALEFSAALLD